jgi:zinc D-Ala-D-Ala carboxypeptidase
MGDLTKNFNAYEFRCTCGMCKAADNKMDMDFVETLQGARDVADRPLKITSGFRCAQHLESLKRPTSSHTLGLAVDISTIDSTARHAIVRALIRVGLSRIGIGKNFVHVDKDPDKPANVMWDYYG